MPESATRFAVLLFTDIVGSTDLKGRFGVPAYRAALATHNGHFERLAREFPSVRILQNMGDGYFAEAGSVAEAVKFALLFQEAMRAGPWGDVALETRVGIHAGEMTSVASEGGSGIVAPAADLAARVMSLAVGGQILLTRFPFDEARHFLREHPALEGREAGPLQWLAHGPYLLKGRDEPMEIFEVGEADLAPLTPPPDGEKARRAVRPGEEETLGWRPAIGLEVPGRADWKLVERLGAGGFGEVWVAERARLGEKRAFKFCFDDARLRALKREVTLTRLLRTALGDREDIVRFFELKLDAPPFYLESEYAPEGNLLEWAERQGGLEKVPMETRLELVAATATALAAAHSVGVLHKDIKPSNVLIFKGRDGEPRPRLVDFGIGTLAEGASADLAGVTQLGFTQMTIEGSSGTPIYSPPEYLAGRPYTMQGDVFGLGVMLYQMVTADTGRPLASGWERDVADEFVRADIAACVDGEPARRLPSAADLATRLRTLVKRRAEAEEERVLARQAAETAEAKVRMQKARLRAVRLRRVAAVFGILAALAVGAGVVAWRQAGKAHTAEMAAKLEMHKAMENRAAADELIAYMQYDLRDSLGKIGRLELMEEVNRRIARYHEEHPAAAGDVPDMALADRERVAMLEQRGSLLRNGGKLEEALEVFRESFKISARLAAAQPEVSDAQRVLGLARNKMAGILRLQGKLPAALEEYRQSLAIFQKISARETAETEWQSDAAVTQVEIAGILVTMGQADEALKAAQAAAEVFDRLAKNEPARRDWRHKGVGAHAQIGEILRAQGKPEPALAEHQASLAQARQLSEEAPLDMLALRDLAVAYDQTGDLQFSLEHDAEAQAMFEKGMEISEKLAAHDPANASWQRDLVVGATKLGNMHLLAARLAEAETAYRKALAVAERLVAKDAANTLWQRDLGMAQAKLGDVLREKKAHAEAIAAYRESLRIRRGLAARDPANAQWAVDYGLVAACLAEALMEQQTPDPAEARRVVVEGNAALGKLSTAAAAGGSARYAKERLEKAGKVAGR